MATTTLSTVSANEEEKCLVKSGKDTWLRQYGSQAESVPLPADQSEDDMANRSKDSYKEENAQLKKRIRELEKALEFSKLETQARDMMIDKAEEYFDISIRKKSGAK